ncbi:RHS repeat-associated core domain-containing protein [Bdellovibrio bacteriovorus]|uniref:RHS repeat-associated core domain-containing protein n=1 Tax=Bdellovibrio bacteriovorus TaxID=959 RepID=UPI0035A60825
MRKLFLSGILLALFYSISANASWVEHHPVLGLDYYTYHHYGLAEKNEYLECRQRVAQTCIEKAPPWGEADLIDDIFEYPPGTTVFRSGCWTGVSPHRLALTCLLHPSSDPEDDSVFPRAFEAIRNFISELPAIRACGSVIDVNRMSVGEHVPVAGAPFDLFYTSEFDSANAANYSTVFNFVIPTAVTQALSWKVIRPSGTYTSSLPIVPFLSQYVINNTINQNLIIIPPESVRVELSATVKIDNNTSISGVFYSADLQLGEKYNYNPKPWGLGGFTLTIHHFLDVKSGRVFYGDGNVSEIKPKSYIDPILGPVFLVPSKDGSEVYVFDNRGFHIETKGGVSGATLFKFSYDNLNRISTVTDRNNLETRIVRDSSTSLKIVSPYNQETLVYFNASKRIREITDPMGESHLFYYYAGNRLMSGIRYPGGRTTYFSYDQFGRFTGESKDNGGFFKLTFSSDKGNISTSTVTAEGVSTHASFSKMYNEDISIYRDANNVVTKVTRNGDVQREIQGYEEKETRYADDVRFGKALKKLVSLKHRQLNVTHSEQMSGSDILRVESLVRKTTTNGKVSFEEYRKDNRTWSFISPSNRRDILYFDEKDQLIKAESPGSLPVSYQYNTRGQLEKVSKGAKEVVYGYNVYGYLNSITDVRKNQTTTFETDILGRTLQVTYPNADFVRYEYTSDGNLKKIRTPNGEEHVFDHDIMGDLRSYLPPILGGTSKQISYTRDKDQRIKKITFPSGKNIEFQYMPGTNRISSQTTELGKANYTYTERNFLKEATSPDGYVVINEWFNDLFLGSKLYSGNQKIGDIIYEYDDEMRIKLIKINSLQIPIRYDSDNRISSIGEELITYEESIDNQNQTASKKEISLIGDSKFVREVVDGENGAVAATKFFPVASDESVFSKIELVSNHAGSSEMHENRNDSRGVYNASYFYTYDAKSRLTRVQKELNGMSRVQTASYNFGVNSNNNVLVYTHGNKVTNAEYDAQDRLKRLVGSITRDYQYDDDGNVLSISNCLGTKSFQYDEHKNLRQVTLQNGRIISYHIDGLNRRVAKLVDGLIQEYYVWYDQTRLAAIVEPDFTTKIVYIYGNHPVAPSYMVRYGKVYKILSTPQGSVKAIYDLQGNLTQEFEYDEYGAILNAKNPFFQPLTFNSGLYDYDTKLVRFGARDYDPEVGRWTSKDPILFAGGDTNLYGYTFNDPINFIDPRGTDACVMNQSTGTVICTNDFGDIVGISNGYSGSGAGLNNPSMENVANMGPTPQGTYIVGAPYNQPGGTGNFTRSLNPTPGTRASFPSNRNPDTFRWHGDNGQGTASQGCPISNRATRGSVRDGSPFRVINWSF